MTTSNITESMSQMHDVIRESARNSEKLVELKERLIKRNAVENEHYLDMKLPGRGHRLQAVPA